ncbi:MAG: RDD family protein [Phycisphaerales bacterium]|jgi:uncharacterized RDD family membrane protein YckC|nr:RDD family protein [Phycisphaerales bacterium]
METLIAVTMAASPAFWFVSPPDASTPVDDLCLVGSPADEDAYTVLRGLSRAPQAMAWSGTSVWIVSGSGGDRPSLLALRADWDAGLDTWATRPLEGFSRVPPVPGPAPIAALVAGSFGPTLALEAGGERGGEAGGEGGGGVYSLRGGQWRARPRPPLEPAERIILAAAQEDAVVLCVGGQRPAAVLRSEHETAAWTRTALELPDGEATDLAFHNGTPVLGIQTGPDERTFGYVQGGAFAPWAVVADVPPAASVVATSGGLGVLDVSAELVRLKAVDAHASAAWVPLRRASRVSAELWSLLVIGAIGIVVVLVIVMGRRANAVPEGTRPAPLARRMIAVGLDLVPGLLACVVVFGAGSVEVMAALVSGPLPATIPLLLLLAGVTVVWGTVWEWCAGQTPGKRLTRLRVLTAGEGGLRGWQVVLRNVLKGIVVLAPPLAVLVLLTPLNQSPGDILARTIVVDDRGGPPAG